MESVKNQTCDSALKHVIKAGFDLSALCHVTGSLGRSNAPKRKVKENVSGADDLLFKAASTWTRSRQTLHRITVQSAHILARRARQPVWSGLVWTWEAG